MGLLTNGIARAIGAAVYAAVHSMAAWAFGGLTTALLATTSVSFGSWFDGPWRAMAAVAALASVPILIAGIIATVAAGAPIEALRRALLAPPAIAFGLVSSRAIVGGLLALVEVMSGAVVQIGIGGTAGFGAAMAKVGAVLGVSAAGSGSVVLPTAASVVVMAIVAVLSFVIWVELALRTALLYLLVAFIPLGLAGLFWSWTATWLRRLGEVILAVAAAQLVITVAMVLAAAAISGTSVRQGAAGDFDSVISAVALLFLGSLGLPLALKVIPHAAEAAVAAGAGARVARRGGQVLRTGGDAISAGTTSAVGRLSGAVVAGRVPAATGAAASLARRPVPTSSSTGGSVGG